MMGFLDTVLRITGVVFILTFFTSYFFYLFLTRRLRKTFTAYFKVYSILAVIFVIIGLYIMRIASEFSLSLLPDGRTFNKQIFNPLIAFGLYSGWLNFTGALINLINLAFYIIIGVLTYNNMKHVM